MAFGCFGGNSDRFLVDLSCLRQIAALGPREVRMRGGIINRRGSLRLSAGDLRVRVTENIVSGMNILKCI